jgi:NAD-dependent deacetylase
VPCSVVVLTGAGVSAESGVPTFRGSGGLWENRRVEDVASPRAFERDPQLVHRFYNGRRRALLGGDIEPNRAHVALAEFERDFPGEFLLVTQNVDDLHERAGSERLIHMHGELLKKRCSHCGDVSATRVDLDAADRCPRCGAQGGLRPHVVWFGEMPLGMDTIEDALRRCDLFVSVGTSGNVYPAAGFVELANARGAHTVEINIEPSATKSSFGERLYGEAGTMLPRFLARLCAGEL